MPKGLFTLTDLEHNMKFPVIDKTAYYETFIKDFCKPQ